ncbi:hypothetical protein Tco_1288194 [Tanacetum coccineum]
MDIVSPTPHDSSLLGGYTPRSDEGRLKLEELMAMCRKLSKQVLDLENEKDAQAVQILKLKKRVKKLETQRKSSISHLKKRIYRQVDSSDDDLDKEDASNQGRTSDKTKPMFKDRNFDDLDDLVDKGMDFVQEKEAWSSEAAEYEKEKEELRLGLKIISNDDSEVNYEPLSRKFPIVNWEYQLLGKMEEKDMLVQERFQDHPLEGHDLLLWGDLRMIFNPNEKDELWMNQLDWKLLRWKLYESYGVHTLIMDGKPMEINMLVEKKYPLIKELLEKMLNLQLEAEEESTMAFKLIKFIKSLLEE